MNAKHLAGNLTARESPPSSQERAVALELLRCWCVGKVGTSAAFPGLNSLRCPARKKGVDSKHCARQWGDLGSFYGLTFSRDGRAHSNQSFGSCFRHWSRHSFISSLALWAWSSMQMTARAAATSETWQRSGSARGVESSSRPAGRRFASDDVRERSPRRAAERRAIDGVTYRAIPSRSESV